MSDRRIQPAMWGLLIALKSAELAHEMPSCSVSQIAELVLGWIGIHDKAHDWDEVEHDYGRKYPKFGGL